MLFIFSNPFFKLPFSPKSRFPYAIKIFNFFNNNSSYLPKIRYTEWDSFHPDKLLKSVEIYVRWNFGEPTKCDTFSHSICIEDTIHEEKLKIEKMYDLWLPCSMRRHFSFWIIAQGSASEEICHWWHPFGDIGMAIEQNLQIVEIVGVTSRLLMGNMEALSEISAVRDCIMWMPQRWRLYMVQRRKERWPSSQSQMLLNAISFLFDGSGFRYLISMISLIYSICSAAVAANHDAEQEYTKWRHEVWSIDIG